MDFASAVSKIILLRCQDMTWFIVMDYFWESEGWVFSKAVDTYWWLDFEMMSSLLDSPSFSLLNDNLDSDLYNKWDLISMKSELYQ
jgi:hypothetical protein